jgi:outer membrane immunogenic protein
VQFWTNRAATPSNQYGSANQQNNFGTTYGTDNLLNPSGPTVGAQGGYNWVTESGFFYGGEADLGYMGSGQHQLIAGNNGTVTAKAVWNGYSTARVRIGAAFDPGLIFVTGGLAAADVRDQVFDSFYKSNALLGWTVGAGAEIAITNNISIAPQYLHIQLPQRVGLGSNIGGGNVYINDSADILRVDVNWHFD